MFPLDDLIGTEAEQCVVVRLSHNYPDLAVKVFKTNPTAYSLVILPSLVAQGITKPVVRINSGVLLKIDRKFHMYRNYCALFQNDYYSVIAMQFELFS